MPQPSHENRSAQSLILFFRLERGKSSFAKSPQRKNVEDRSSWHFAIPPGSEELFARRKYRLGSPVDCIIKGIAQNNNKGNSVSSVNTQTPCASRMDSLLVLNLNQCCQTVQHTSTRPTTTWLATPDVKLDRQQFWHRKSLSPMELLLGELSCYQFWRTTIHR